MVKPGYMSLSFFVKQDAWEIKKNALAVCQYFDCSAKRRIPLDAIACIISCFFNAYPALQEARVEIKLMAGESALYFSIKSAEKIMPGGTGAGAEQALAIFLDNDPWPFTLNLDLL